MPLNFSWPSRTEAHELWLTVHAKAVDLDVTIEGHPNTSLEVKATLHQPFRTTLELPVDQRGPENFVVTLTPSIGLLPARLDLEVRGGPAGGKQVLLYCQSLRAFSRAGQNVAIIAWLFSFVLAGLVILKIKELPLEDFGTVFAALSTLGMGAYVSELIRNHWPALLRLYDLRHGAAFVLLSGGALTSCLLYLHRVENRTNEALELRGGLVFKEIKLEAGAHTVRPLAGLASESFKALLLKGAESVCFGEDCGYKLPGKVDAQSTWEPSLTVFCKRKISYRCAVATDSKHGCSTETPIDYYGPLLLDQCNEEKNVSPQDKVPDCSVAVAARRAKAKSDTPDALTIASSIVRYTGDGVLTCDALVSQLELRNETQKPLVVTTSPSPQLELRARIESKNRAGDKNGADHVTLALPKDTLAGGLELKVHDAGSQNHAGPELGTLHCVSQKPARVRLLDLRDAGLTEFRVTGNDWSSVWVPDERRRGAEVVAFCEPLKDDKRPTYEVILNHRFWPNPEWKTPLPVGERLRVVVFRGEQRWGNVDCERRGRAGLVLTPVRIVGASLQAFETASATNHSSDQWQQIAQPDEPHWVWQCRDTTEVWTEGEGLVLAGSELIFEAGAFTPRRQELRPCFVPQHEGPPEKITPAGPPWSNKPTGWQCGEPHPEWLRSTLPAKWTAKANCAPRQFSTCIRGAP